MLSHSRALGYRRVQDAVAEIADDLGVVAPVVRLTRAGVPAISLHKGVATLRYPRRRARLDSAGELRGICAHELGHLAAGHLAAARRTPVLTVVVCSVVLAVAVAVFSSATTATVGVPEGSLAAFLLLPLTRIATLGCGLALTARLLRRRERAGGFDRHVDEVEADLWAVRVVGHVDVRNALRLLAGHGGVWGAIRGRVQALVGVLMVTHPPLPLRIATVAEYDPADMPRVAAARAVTVWRR